MNERDRIIEILFSEIKSTKISCNEENACERCLFPCESKRIAEKCADALIATGIGDVAAWKKRAEVAEHDKNDDEYCPICRYKISQCQCVFSGSAHPDRSKRKDVVKDHLYLLSPTQLKHLIELEEFWRTSYSDDEKTAIYEDLKKQAERKIEEEESNGKK